MFGAIDNTVHGSHTEREWTDLLAQWNWQCFYCGESVRKNSPDPSHEATKDHMIPISRGGVDFISNIAPACLRCNQLKSNKTAEEFRAERAWVLREKSTGNTMYAAPQNFPQSIRSIDSVPVVEILAPAPPLPTIEIAAMWKKVLDKAAREKVIDGERASDAYWQQRRAMLKAQAEGIKRTRLEAAGQLVLPIFGDGAAKKLAQSEAATMPFLGMDMEEV